MAATYEEIKGWFDKATERGATHLVVVCDTYDHDDYPVYVMPGEDVLAKIRAPGEMQRVMEVYKISLGWAAQADVHVRYWNL